MTEQEILKRQAETGNREFFLMLVGKFLHAYGNGAFALARATGYRVLRKQRRGGDVLTCGFPMGSLEQVRQRLHEAGGIVEKLDEKTYLFRGPDGTPDPQLVSEPQPKPAAQPGKAAAAEQGGGDHWLVEAVRGYNLSLSTPVDAMLFVRNLQQQLNDRNACESSVGQGLQE